MVFIRGRRIHGKKVTVYTNGKTRVQYSEIQRQHKLERGSSSRTTVDLSMLCPRTSSASEPTEIESPAISESSNKGIYVLQKEKRCKDWLNVIESLCQIGLSLNVAETQFCRKCHKSCEEIYRCKDCGPSGYMCSNCLDEEHQFPHLHFFEQFKNGTFITLCRETPVWTRADQHSCNSSFIKNVVIVDDQGRQHVRRLKVCGCETTAETMVRLQLWPSSPKNPGVCFHVGLLEWMTVLLTECHLSIKGFCDALQIRFSKHDVQLTTLQIKNLYKILITDTATWYRHYQYKIRYPTHIIDKLDDGTACPACYTMPQKIYSIDADFQLVRKASSGTSIAAPKHAGRFFEVQENVDTFVKSYDDSEGKNSIDCSDFQAGNKLRSKIKTSKLDETALFGSSCRHEIPVSFFNLRHGERLSYSVYLIRKLLEKNPEEKIHVMYDIACQLDSHLKKKNCDDILERLSLSVPVFHNYGHKMLCQILYNPRRTEGIGLTDGECMERLWSFLGRFSSIAKEMTPENKTDLLVDALLNYTFKNKAKLGEVLVSKHQKAEKLEQNTRNMLHETIHKLDGITEQVVEVWSSEEKAEMRRLSENKRITTDRVGDTWEETYTEKLQRFYELRSALQKRDVECRTNVEKKLQGLEKQLGKIEKEHGFIRWVESFPKYQELLIKIQQKQLSLHLNQLQTLISERNFMLNLMKKYARGQSVAIRISRQLKRITQAIKKSIGVYNTLNYGRNLFPEHLEYSIVTGSEFWTRVSEVFPLPTSGTTSNAVPSELESDCIRMFELIKRCIEEKTIVCEEMKSCLCFYENQHSLITNAFESEPCPASKAVIIKEGMYVEATFTKLVQSFFPYIDITGNLTYFHHIVGLQNDNPNSNNFSGSAFENLFSSETLLPESSALSFDNYDISDSSSDEDFSDVD